MWWDKTEKAITNTGKHLPDTWEKGPSRSRSSQYSVTAEDPPAKILTMWQLKTSFWTLTKPTNSFPNMLSNSQGSYRDHRNQSDGGLPSESQWAQTDMATEHLPAHGLPVATSTSILKPQKLYPPLNKIVSGQCI